MKADILVHPLPQDLPEEQKESDSQKQGAHLGRMTNPSQRLHLR
jgi:hypothetical protein